jgi:hypothetical protein
LPRNQKTTRLLLRDIHCREATASSLHAPTARGRENTSPWESVLRLNGGTGIEIFDRSKSALFDSPRPRSSRNVLGGEDILRAQEGPRLRRAPSDNRRTASACAVPEEGTTHVVSPCVGGPRT